MKISRRKPMALRMAYRMRWRKMDKRINRIISEQMILYPPVMPQYYEACSNSNAQNKLDITQVGWESMRIMNIPPNYNVVTHFDLNIRPS